nr:uncharacterized protein CTRU02_03758 [Colletotrichum truncatum]KAF6796780.1 hypothetical protein CTRU02_03758 [Colletotrichum truncatum]
MQRRYYDSFRAWTRRLPISGCRVLTGRHKSPKPLETSRRGSIAFPCHHVFRNPRLTTTARLAASDRPQGSNTAALKVIVAYVLNVKVLTTGDSSFQQLQKERTSLPVPTSISSYFADSRRLLVHFFHRRRGKLCSGRCRTGAPCRCATLPCS